MAWVYLEPDFPDHPKVVAAGDAAGWLHVCALAYCKRYGTDGRVPKAQVPRLISGRTSALIPRLLAAPAGYEFGLWEDHGDHYQIHDYADWNARSEARSEAGRKAAAARWQSGSHAKRNAKRNAIADANPDANGMRNNAQSPSPKTTTYKVSPTGRDAAPPETTTDDDGPDDLLLDVAAARARRLDHDNPTPGWLRTTAQSLNANEARKLANRGQTPDEIDLALDGHPPAGPVEAFLAGKPSGEPQPGPAKLPAVRDVLATPPKRVADAHSRAAEARRALDPGA